MAGSSSGERDDRRRRRAVELTDAELRLLAALEDYIAFHGHVPSYRTLGSLVGWRSPATVCEYVGRLRARGIVEGNGRGLRVVR